MSSSPASKKTLLYLKLLSVAAHAYDLRSAKELGIETVYIQRWTEDPDEDMAVV